MSANSKSVHDATVALQDAANAAVVFGRAASALIGALDSVVDLEARIEVLERAITHFEAAWAGAGKTSAAVETMDGLAMRSHVDTKTASDLLGRTPQTLRKWACYGDGPLRPMRVNGRLAWAVADIRRLLHLG